VVWVTRFIVVISEDRDYGNRAMLEIFDEEFRFFGKTVIGEVAAEEKDFRSPGCMHKQLPMLAFGVAAIV
jgi:hypothetical protein